MPMGPCPQIACVCHICRAPGVLQIPTWVSPAHWQVETLKMGWCNIGPDDGAKAVADLLMFNSTLVVLDLRGNGLGNAGAHIS